MTTFPEPEERQILDSWLTGPLLPRIGSNLLQGLLELSLRHLNQTFNIEVPSTCRQVQALDLLRALHANEFVLDPRNKRDLIRLEAAWRTAWEIALIVHAAFVHRANPHSPFTRARLAAVLGGHPLADRSDPTARNAQFELANAALFAHTGTDIWAGEPDFQVPFPSERIGVAAKRVTSLAAKQLDGHIKQAIVQLSGAGLRGIVALNLDSRLADATLPDTDEERGLLFVKRLDPVLEHLGRCIQDDQVLGVMVFAQCYRWVFPKKSGEGTPLLDSALPMRWITWERDPTVRTLIDNYQRAWKASLQHNLAAWIADVDRRAIRSTTWNRTNASGGSQ